MSNNSSICGISFSACVDSYMSWDLHASVCCQVILDCTSDILTIRLWDPVSCLNPMENVDTCFTRWSILLDQAANSPQTFVGCGFDFSPILKAFEVLFGFVLHVSHPEDCLGPGWWFSLSSALKVLGMFFGIRNTHAQCRTDFRSSYTM